MRVCLASDGATALVGATQGWTRNCKATKGVPMLLWLPVGGWTQQAGAGPAARSRNDTFWQFGLGTRVGLSSGPATVSLWAGPASETLTVRMIWQLVESGSETHSEERAQSGATFGRTVVLSGDGATALIGAPSEALPPARMRGVPMSSLSAGRLESAGPLICGKRRGSSRNLYGFGVPGTRRPQRLIIRRALGRERVHLPEDGIGLGFVLPTRNSAGASEDDFGWAVRLS